MKGYIISIITGFVLIGCGIGFLAFEVMDYDYVEGLPVNLSESKKTYSYDLNEGNIYFDIDEEYTKIITDDSITPGTINTEVIFYGKAFNLYTSQEITPTGKIIRYSTGLKTNGIKYFYKITIDGLKDKKIYDYEKLEDMTINVYVNSVDLEKVKNYQNLNFEQKFYIDDETILCPQMLEEIARDDEYIYYFNCVKSNSVYLIYNNGTKISVRAALNRGTITIEQLLEAGLSVIKEPINISL